MSILKKIGIPIVEHCNLNCKGCLHFCNLNQEEFYYDCNEYKSDLNRLAELFENIEVIRLYGGEPLLHPELIKLLEITRKYLKNSKIEVLTNGLLLPYLDEYSFEVIKNLEVYIRWSSYPIENGINMKIEDKLIAERVPYYKNEVKEFYGIFNPIGNSNPNYQWEHCSGRDCHVLRKGYISVCPAPAVEHIINKTFNQQLDFTTSRLNIYDKNIDAEKIIEFLEKPHDVCKYCEGARMFIWEKQNKPIIEDWYGKGEKNERGVFSN